MTRGEGPGGQPPDHLADAHHDVAAAPDVDPATARLLAALLRLDPAVAAEIRARAARARPRPQAGPAADYGE